MRMDQTQQEMIGQPVRSLQYMLRRQWILLWKSVRHLTGRLA